MHAAAGGGGKGTEASFRSNQARLAAINRRKQLLQKAHNTPLSSDSQSTAVADMFPSVQPTVSGDQAPTVLIPYSQLDHANEGVIDNPPLVAEAVGSGDPTEEEAMEGVAELLNDNQLPEDYQDHNNVDTTNDVEVFATNTHNSNSNSRGSLHSVRVSVPGLLLEGMQMIVSSFSSINSFSSRGSSARDWQYRSSSSSNGSGSGSAPGGGVQSSRSSGSRSRHSSQSRSHSGEHSAEILNYDKNSTPNAGTISRSGSQGQAVSLALPTIMSITAINEEDEVSILSKSQVPDTPNVEIEGGQGMPPVESGTDNTSSVRNKPQPRPSSTITAMAVSAASSLFLGKLRLSSDPAPSRGGSGSQEGGSSPPVPVAAGLILSSFSNSSAITDDAGTGVGGNSSKKSALGRDRAPSPSDRLLAQSNKKTFFFPTLLPQLSLRAPPGRVLPSSFSEYAMPPSARHSVAENLSGGPDLELADLPAASLPDGNIAVIAVDTQHEMPRDQDASRMRIHTRARQQVESSHKHSNGTPGGSGNGGQTRRSFAGTMLTNLVETFSSPTEQQIASLEGIMAKEASLEQAAGRVRVRHKLHFDADAEEIVAESMIERRR